MSDFERNLREQLRAEELKLDDETLRQLKAGRTRAIAHNRRFRLRQVLVPLGGMTLASIAIFFLVLSPLPPTSDNARRPMVMENGDLKDLDFYYWLAETQDSDI